MFCWKHVSAKPRWCYPNFESELDGCISLVGIQRTELKTWYFFCAACHKITAEYLKGLRLFMRLHVGARGPTVKPSSFPFLFSFFSFQPSQQAGSHAFHSGNEAKTERVGAGWGGLAWVQLGGGAVFLWLNLILLPSSRKKKSRYSPSPWLKLLSAHSQAIKAAMRGFLFLKKKSSVCHWNILLLLCFFSTLQLKLRSILPPPPQNDFVWSKLGTYFP